MCYVVKAKIRISELTAVQYALKPTWVNSLYVRGATYANSCYFKQRRGQNFTKLERVGNGTAARRDFRIWMSASRHASLRHTRAEM